MEAVLLHPDQLSGVSNPLKGVWGVYVLLANDCSEAVYVGQAYNLHRRLREQLGWISPGRQDTIINRFTGHDNSFFVACRLKGLTAAQIRPQLRLAHSAARNDLRVAVVINPDCALDLLESDLIEWLKPRFNGLPPMPRLWNEDERIELESRVTPYLAMLDKAVTQTAATVEAQEAA
jgi:hypothetical protein